MYRLGYLCSLIMMLNISDDTCNILLMVNKLFIILIGNIILCDRFYLQNLITVHRVMDRKSFTVL